MSGRIEGEREEQKEKVVKGGERVLKRVKGG